MNESLADWRAFRRVGGFFASAASSRRRFLISSYRRQRRRQQISGVIRGTESVVGDGSQNVVIKFIAYSYKNIFSVLMSVGHIVGQKRWKR